MNACIVIVSVFLSNGSTRTVRTTEHATQSEANLYAVQAQNLYAGGNGSTVRILCRSSRTK